jgi:hypothetical protein
MAITLIEMTDRPPCIHLGYQCQHSRLYRRPDLCFVSGEDAVPDARAPCPAMSFFLMGKQIDRAFVVADLLKAAAIRGCRGNAPTKGNIRL